MQSLRGSKSPFGFTLLELLVVLTIAGLLVALVPPLYSKAVPGAILKTASLDFAMSLREARSRAISANKAMQVTLFADPPSYAVGNTSAAALPDGIFITAYDYFATTPGSAADRHVLTEDKIVTHFYPDGSSTGATFAVNNGITAYRISVSWLTGTITMSGAEDNEY